MILLRLQSINLQWENLYLDYCSKKKKKKTQEWVLINSADKISYHRIRYLIFDSCLYKKLINVLNFLKVKKKKKSRQATSYGDHWSLVESHSTQKSPERADLYKSTVYVLKRGARPLAKRFSTHPSVVIVVVYHDRYLNLILAHQRERATSKNLLRNKKGISIFNLFKQPDIKENTPTQTQTQSQSLRHRTILPSLFLSLNFLYLLFLNYPLQQQKRKKKPNKQNGQSLCLLLFILLGFWLYYSDRTQIFLLLFSRFLSSQTDLRFLKRKLLLKSVFDLCAIWLSELKID